MKKSCLLLLGLLLPAPLPAQTPPASSAPVDIEEIKAQNARITELNDLLTQANAATRAGDWAKEKNVAEKLLALNAKLIAAYPDDDRFAGDQPAYAKLLGDAHLNLGEYEAAAAAYEKCAGAGQALIDGGKGSAKVKQAVGQALTSEGNTWLKLKKSQEALACYKRATQFDPHPATAWFNICAVMYNTGHTSEAMAAADQVIALDPTKADAYFIKGSCRFGDATVGPDGKAVVPAEAVNALKKYLELAPNGPHANDVKQMLEYAGVHAP
ncbi:MAG TPA: hypothetical protein VMI53_14385 [Opitutaceae bacterium]|nr:hypothetical protein [Opitutaceae bacterium]